MKREIEIQFGDIILRSIQKRDIEFIRILRNKNRQYFLYSGIISTEEQCKWYEKYEIAELDYMFIAFLKNNEEELAVGTAAIYDIDTKAGSCEFGRIIVDHDATNRRGLGVEIVNAVCKIAKQQFGVKVVKLEVYENNAPAIKTYLKAGFKAIGKRTNDDKMEVLMMEKQVN